MKGYQTAVSTSCMVRRWKERWACLKAAVGELWLPVHTPTASRVQPGHQAEGGGKSRKLRVRPAPPFLALCHATSCP